ncbi:PEP-CTERM sorting domain-containing protein [Planctomycetota bacterium]
MLIHFCLESCLGVSEPSTLLLLGLGAIRLHSRQAVMVRRKRR